MDMKGIWKTGKLLLLFLCKTFFNHYLHSLLSSYFLSPPLSSSFTLSQAVSKLRIFMPLSGRQSAWILKSSGCEPDSSSVISELVTWINVLVFLNLGLSLFKIGWTLPPYNIRVIKQLTGTKWSGWYLSYKCSVILVCFSSPIQLWIGSYESKNFDLQFFK